MSQTVWTSINPDTTSGLMLAGILDDFKDAIVTGLAGTSRPANLQAGGMWIDTTNQVAPSYYWAFNLFDGTNDTEIFRISVLNGFGGALTANGTFTIQEIAADAVGPVLELVKQRLAANGQVLDGDTVGEIRFTGRTDTSTNPAVAYFKHVATDDQITADSGGTFSMYSTPDGTAAIAEHLRFISGVVESVVPHKLNSQILVNQNVATTATIAQLSATKVLVEMTGSTATDIQGINSAGETRYIIIHNRSSAQVTLKNQNSSATTTDRFKLPLGNDHVIAPQVTTTLYYCDTDLRWKLKSSTSRKLLRSIEKLNGAYQQWTAPATTRIKIIAYQSPGNFVSGSRFIDSYGNMYTWGLNTNGQLGLGDVTPRSSPVIVLGSLQFMPWTNNLNYPYGLIAGQVYLTQNGQAYGFGANDRGQLGVGDVTPRSSPVAVLGGLKFSGIVTGAASAYGITHNGTAYAWGVNFSGELGVGDVNPRSSPVAVLGGLKFSRIISDIGDTTSLAPFIGISRSGDAYAWGGNSDGVLGLGDVAARSSPVAVLGGLKFKKIFVGGGTGKSALAISSTGAAYTWGINTNGQLGVGDVTSRSSPVAVLGGLTFVDVFTSTTNSYSMFGITSDGTLYSWGDNSNGQLGVGDVTPRSSPVAVLGGLRFSKVYAAGQGEIFGITTDGTLYSWGLNTDGSLGLGDINSRSSPVAVLGGGVWNWVSGTSGSATGILGAKSDGTLYSWGTNTSGNLGVGDITKRSSPVLVLGAFGAALNTPSIEVEVDVVSGTTYDVVLSQALSTFGPVPLGYNIENITIQYDN